MSCTVGWTPGTPGCRVCRGPARCGPSTWTGEPYGCDFAPTSGTWLETADGERWALTAQPIDRDGSPGGPFLTVTRIEDDGSVPALDPKTVGDASGTPPGCELGGSVVIETFGSATNALGPLQHVCTLPVPTSTHPHPDGAMLVGPATGPVFTYTGRGAALNDRFGGEVGADGRYLPLPAHVAITSGFELIACEATRHLELARAHPGSPEVAAGLADAGAAAHDRQPPLRHRLPAVIVSRRRSRRQSAAVTADSAPTSAASLRTQVNPPGRSTAPGRHQADLIDADRLLFVHQGYVKTTPTQIADHAGVSARTVSVRFATKAKLFARVVDQALHPADRRRAPAPGPRGPHGAEPGRAHRRARRRVRRHR